MLLLWMAMLDYFNKSIKQNLQQIILLKNYRILQIFHKKKKIKFKIIKTSWTLSFMEQIFRKNTVKLLKDLKTNLNKFKTTLRGNHKKISRLFMIFLINLQIKTIKKKIK